MLRSLLSAAALALVLSAPAIAADTLPLTRITLSTSGLAQFEHQGTVTGNTTLSLPVRLDQVDDVLKSLVVLDAKGGFGGVSLPGREPLSTIFRDLPFDQSALDNPEALLKSLQGAEISVTSGADIIRGKLVNVVPEQSITKDQQIVRRHRVTILTDAGLKTALLEDLKTLQFTEPAVQGQVGRALAAIYANRVQDQRLLTLNLKGEGARPVSLSYVTAAPVWKSAYRLVLPVKDSGTAYLQGWAILENTTGQDWNNVAITLLSGNPVTYQQSLYESYYLDRPFLPLRVMDRLMPRVDEGSTVLAITNPSAAPENAPRRMNKAALMESPMVAGMAAGHGGGMEMMAADMAYAVAPPMPATMAGAQTAIAEQATASMVFRFPQSFDLPAGNTMMLPVIGRDIPAQQLWLYQPDTNARHPLTAVSLQNDSETGLPPGILTLFEQDESGLRYTGDAELALLPKGETRYVTFALDPATTIDRADDGTRQYGAFTASKGVIRQKVVSTMSTTYTIKAPVDAARVLVIEHPRQPGWTLKAPDGLTGEPEQTERFYRLKLDLPAGETKVLQVVLERAEFEHIALGQMSPDDLRARMNAVGVDIDDKTRKAMDGAILIQAEIQELDAQVQTLEQKRQMIFNDQSRVRGNLESIPDGSDLAKRYLTELNAQEDQLKKIDAQHAEIQTKRDDAQNRLNTYIAGLEL